MEKLKKSILSIMLLITLVFTQSYQVYAEAGTLSVIGGSFATGGLSAGAIGAAAAPYVIPVIAAGLVACGVDVALSEASQEAGMTKSEFLRTKIAEYCEAAGKPIDDFWQGFANNVSIAENGAIYLGNAASKQLKQFGEWLFQNDLVIDDAGTGGEVPSFVVGQVTLGGYTFPVVNSLTVEYSTGSTYSLTFNHPVAVCFQTYANQRGNDLCFFNITTNTILSWNSGSTNTLANVNGSNYYYYNTYSPTALKTVDGINIPTLSNAQKIYEFLREQDGTFDMTQAGINEDTFTGTRDDWSSGSQALDTTQGHTTVINPDITVDLPDILNPPTVGVRDYLDGLTGVFDGVGAVDIPVVDPVTGEIDNVRVIDEPFDPVIENEDDTTLDPDPTPALDPSVPADADDALPPLVLDLRNVFPFCLPFDAVDMIRLLSAEPVAPRYTVNWHVPIIDTDMSFTVDLSGFDNAARVMRTMELLAFCIALAIATRHIIRS